MAKRVKKNVSNVKKMNKNVDDKKKLSKKKLTEEKENERKPAIVKARNLRFKSKNKKNKVIKTVQKIHKNKENGTSVNLLNTDIAKVVDLKNKKGQNQGKNKAQNQGKNKKGQNQIQNKKGQIQVQNKKQQFKDNKQTQNKQSKKNKISDQSKNKISNNEQKFVKETRSRSIEPKMKQKQKVKNDKTAKLNSVLTKKLKSKINKSSNASTQKCEVAITRQHNLDVKRLKELLVNKEKENKKKKIIEKPQSLRQKMMSKLKASRFRYLNETLYNNASSESKKFFKNDPDAFKAYHDGYNHQVEQWPLNPLDVIISSIKKMPKQYIIADFGCGEGRLAASVPHKVHSFDFVSLNENVTVCDIAHTPLLTSGVNVVVFCLSLMGTNLKDYIIEANRVLKKDGILKIAEVESRFDQIEDFIKTINSYGFKHTWKDLSHNLFYFLDFKKEKDISGKKNKLPPITLKPCLYKKR
ncbi:unnamed protein product [Xylocopa violacea]|uniref:Ribosomal RNA-processing protein 8 n=1 Tax=Xylocopa violacea TaxID=135666 RepID=A0ABP1P0T8_XYLVO